MTAVSKVMERFQLPASTHIGSAHLYTANLERALSFYGDLMGFQRLSKEDNRAVLSADGKTPHIILTERRDASPKPANSTGLYHVAIRLPSRLELARLFRRMVTQRYPFGGFSDHAVSEALYLNDVDENGLELYRDRPRDEWPRQNGTVTMTTRPLDIQKLLADADDKPWTGIHRDTDIGHVHLHVASLEKAKAFYSDLLGLDVASDWSGHGALFLSAGGYHHHLGVNIWAGTRRQPENTLGLHSFTLVIPERAAWETAKERVVKTGMKLEVDEEKRFAVRDENGNQVELTL